MINQIKLQEDDALNAHMMFIPSLTIECREMLQENGLNNKDFIKPFSFNLVLLEDDLMSLELPDNFMRFMLEDDDTYKLIVRQSIEWIERRFGSIKYKFCKGTKSAQILTRLKMASAEKGESKYGGESVFDCLIMLDRDIDLISPLLTQLVYEGLIDEVFGINTTVALVDSKALKKEVKESDPQVIKLNLTNE